MKTMRNLSILLVSLLVMLVSFSSCGSDDNEPSPTPKPTPADSYGYPSDDWKIPLPPMTDFKHPAKEIYEHVKKYCSDHGFDLRQTEKIDPSVSEPGLIQYQFVDKTNEDFPLYFYIFEFDYDGNNVLLKKLIGCRTVSPNKADKVTDEKGVSDFTKNALKEMDFEEIVSFDPNIPRNGLFWNSKLKLRLDIGDYMVEGWKGFPTMFYFSPSDERPE